MGKVTHRHANTGAPCAWDANNLVEKVAFNQANATLRHSLDLNVGDTLMHSVSIVCICATAFVGTA